MESAMKTELLALPLCLLFSATALAAAGNQRLPAQEAGYQAERELAAAPATAQDRDCARPTGTRIVRKDRDGCVIGAGRTYHRRDIDSTGARDAGAALQMLDPSISGRR
jgi:hypothetical protein